jgi:heme-degrading monooxygenase HmoA
VGFLRRVALPAYGETDGHLGATILRRDREGNTEFVLITFWRDLAAVQRFAGAAHDRAVFYPEDDAFLVDRELHTDHYEVAALQLEGLAAFHPD